MCVYYSNVGYYKYICSQRMVGRGALHDPSTRCKSEHGGACFERKIGCKCGEYGELIDHTYKLHSQEVYVRGYVIQMFTDIKIQGKGTSRIFQVSLFVVSLSGCSNAAWSTARHREVLNICSCNFGWMFWIEVKKIGEQRFKPANRSGTEE